MRAQNGPCIRPDAARIEAPFLGAGQSPQGFSLPQHLTLAVERERESERESGEVEEGSESAPCQCARAGSLPCSLRGGSAARIS